MNLNKNDYVIVNGKKYFAEGGKKYFESGGITVKPERRPDEEEGYENLSEEEKKAAWKNYYKTYYESSEKFNPQNWYSRDGRSELIQGTGRIGDPNTIPQGSDPNKSPDHGVQYYTSLPDENKTYFRNGRDILADYIRYRLGNNDEKYKKYGISLKDLTDFDKDTEDVTGANFDNELSNTIYGVAHKLNPKIFKGDSSPNGVYLGANVVNQMQHLGWNDNESLYDPDEQAEIKRAYEYQLGKEYNPAHWQRRTTPNGAIYTVYDELDDEGYPKTWRNLYYSNADGRLYGISKDKLSSVSNGIINDTRNNHAAGVKGNDKDLTINLGKFSEARQKQAYGGSTTRLFASGGDMGAIPMGEQSDYNMVGAGGSHEMNPQGGVPYGMNQDGTQNMVEQGEVSVGNNVFSDRTAISPELCQQLGLPEGTSHAQAMQQIEQLYEQGQIGDQEYQEISQIIFQDQEMQKGGGMPQNEGLQPEMLGQQAAMPSYAYGGCRRR